MLIAMDESARRIAPSPNTRALCPECRGAVVAKCGDLVSWHWAHLAANDACWASEGETPWHVAWKERFPVEQREVRIVRGGVCHVADVRGATRVLEFQHSSISADEIREREKFYGRMAWIFDCQDAREAWRVTIRIHDDGRVSFRWRHPRLSIKACRQPVLLDIGTKPYSRLLQVLSIRHQRYFTGWARWLDRDHLVQFETGSPNRDLPLLRGES